MNYTCGHEYVDRDPRPLGPEFLLCQPCTLEKEALYALYDLQFLDQHRPEEREFWIQWSQKRLQWYTRYQFANGLAIEV